MVQKTSWLGGSMKMIVMSTTQMIATPLMNGANRPRLQGARERVIDSPRPVSRFRKLSQIGITYAR